jgi:hypothetical protein
MTRLTRRGVAVVCATAFAVGFGHAATQEMPQLSPARVSVQVEQDSQTDTASVTEAVASDDDEEDQQ